MVGNDSKKTKINNYNTIITIIITIVNMQF